MHGHFRHTSTVRKCGSFQFVCVRSFIERDVFDNSVLFDNTTPIYLITLLWKLGLELGLDLEVHYFRIFAENNDKMLSHRRETALQGAL